MATTWGLTDSGIYCPTQAELIADRKARLRASLDADLDLGDGTVLGQIVGVDTRGEALAWETLRALYAGIDPDSAEGAALENLAKLTGTVREAARPTYVRATCTLAAGVLLEAGAAFAAISGRESTRATPVADFTAPSSGNFDVLFRLVETGPIPVPAGELSVIASPVLGWSAVTNAADGVIGADVASDSELRLDRDDDLARAGGSTAQALRADVKAAAPTEILSVDVLENKTPTTDGNGLPPNSFEVVIWDSGGAASDDAVAQAIFDSAPAGIQPYGSDSGDAVDADTGDVIPVAFSRAVEVEIWITATLEIRTGYVGDAETAAAWAAALNAISEVGDEVVALRARAWPLSLAGVHDVPAFTIGTAPAPVGSADIPITPRQIARFSSSRITIAHA